MIDKAEPLKATMNIPTLKLLAVASIFAIPRDPVDRIAQSSLDVDTFHLLMKNLKFEVQAHNAWLQKCVGIVNANAWAQQHHKLELNKTAVEAVTWVLEWVCPASLRLGSETRRHYQ